VNFMKLGKADFEFSSLYLDLMLHRRRARATVFK
jgi:hypothetical protein